MFGLDDVITAGSNLITTIVNKFAPDATTVEHDKMTQALTEMSNQYSLLLAQVDVNKTEATSTNVFVSGWRPFIGWVCGISLAYVSILEPFIRFVAIVIFKYDGTFPVIDPEITSRVLIGILGLGAYRSYDKLKGTSK
jgi:hypothetical protein